MGRVDTGVFMDQPEATPAQNDDNNEMNCCEEINLDDIFLGDTEKGMKHGYMADDMTPFEILQMNKLHAPSNFENLIQYETNRPQQTIKPPLGTQLSDDKPQVEVDKCTSLLEDLDIEEVQTLKEQRDIEEKLPLPI